MIFHNVIIRRVRLIFLRTFLKILSVYKKNKKRKQKFKQKKSKSNKKKLKLIPSLRVQEFSH